MSGTTSVPQPTFTTAGFVAPSEPDVLTGVLADLQAAFGGKLNPALETPQGQLASSFTAIIGDKDAQFLALANGVDPAYAFGRMQDAIARIYFLSRKPAQPTTVTATCTGLVGAVIPTGAIAQSQDGNLYACTEGGTIGLGGTVDLPFANLVTGPIACAAHALSIIYQVVPGWDTIDNAADGVLGTDVESRAAFELRRSLSVSLNAVGSVGAVQAAVLNVPGVLDAHTVDNDSNSPVTLDGVTIGAHSLYVCAAGGDPQAIAQAIWTKKAPGCGTAGGTTETVVDNNSGYALPYPTYTVKFQTAIPQTFVFLVTLADTGAVPGDVQTLVSDAIITAFSGADGGSRARIGSSVYASRFYYGVSNLGLWSEIVSIQMGASTAPDASFTASIATTVMTVSAVASGTLAVGQTIMGAGLPDGVQIISLGTGAGGTGTYNLNLPQTISSEAMVAVIPNDSVVTVGVAHVPVISSANITVAIV